MSLPLDAAQALLRSMGNEAKSIFTIDNSPVFDPAGFLADPDAPPLSQQPAKALGRAICRSWANRQGDGNNPAADRLYARACSPYLDSIGEEPENGSVGLPFEGGQCNEVYVVTISVTLNESEPSTLFRRARGPIRGVVVEPSGTGFLGVYLLANGMNSGTQDSCGPVSGNSPNRFFLASAGTSPEATAEASIVSITPCGADNCGNPPPVYEPPRPINITVPVVPVFITLPGIGDINVDVEVFPDATISLCSEEVDTCVQIGNPTDDGGGGGIGPDDLVPDGGTAGSPADTGNGGTAAGEAPPGQELVGVRVEVLEAPIGANEYSNVAVTAYRGVGYVRMGYSGRLALDMGGAAVISPQFFLAPVRGLTNWEVRANLGFINRVTPFYRDLPS